MLWHKSADATSAQWSILPFIEQVNRATVAITVVTSAILFHLELSSRLACKSTHVLWLRLLLLHTTLALGTRCGLRVFFIILIAVARGAVEGFGVLALRGLSGLCGGGSFGRGADASRAVGVGIASWLLSNLLVMLTGKELSRIWICGYYCGAVEVYEGQYLGWEWKNVGRWAGDI
jgi:hypothetical protein